MKKTTKLLNLSSFFLMIILTGCSIHSESTTSNYSKRPDVQAKEVGLVIKPLVADLEVINERKIVVYKVDLKLPNSTINDNAMKLFLETFECDFVVDPKFVKKTIVTNSKTSEIEITLSGFPAKYKKIYQVDSIPKSVMQYSSLVLPIKTVDYLSSYSSDVTGNNLGLEFLYGGAGYVGAQIDFAPNIKKMHFFASFENFVSENDENVKFNYYSPGESVGVERNSSYNNVVMYSAGFFYEKEIMRNFKIRGLSGVSYSTLSLLNPSINGTDQTQIDGFNIIGLKVGGVLDYSLIKGFSIIGKAQSNINLYNSLIQSGKANVDKYDGLTIDKYPIVNFSVGVRFSF